MAIALIAADRIASAIRFIRGQKVLLDADLAVLYGVPTATLNQAVQRNRERFPLDFMFRLTRQEFSNLRSQFVISRSWGGRRSPPLAFSEQGVAMLSGVLRSPRAVAANIEIMRAFVQLRWVLGSHEELARKLDALEQKHDTKFKVVFQAIRELMAPPKPPQKIGFRHRDRS